MIRIVRQRAMAYQANPNSKKEFNQDHSTHNITVKKATDSKKHQIKTTDVGMQNKEDPFLAGHCRKQCFRQRSQMLNYQHSHLLILMAKE